MTDNIDAADISWSSSPTGDIRGMILYEDRPLTRWEWVRVRIFRRRDPRIRITHYRRRGWQHLVRRAVEEMMH
jgi:hypothetical protein